MPNLGLQFSGKNFFCILHGRHLVLSSFYSLPGHVHPCFLYAKTKLNTPKNRKAQAQNYQNGCPTVKMVLTVNSQHHSLGEHQPFISYEKKLSELLVLDTSFSCLWNSWGCVSFEAHGYTWESPLTMWTSLQNYVCAFFWRKKHCNFLEILVKKRAHDSEKIRSTIYLG